MGAHEPVVASDAGKLVVAGPFTSRVGFEQLTRPKSYHFRLAP